MLVHDLDVRVINAATGELLRRLTVSPASDYQPTGRRGEAGSHLNTLASSLGSRGPSSGEGAYK